MYGEKKMKKSKKITGIAGATLIGTTVFYLKTRRKAKKERTKKEQIQQKENQQEQKKQSQKKSIQAHKSLRKESKVVQTKKQYGDFSLTALSFASISIFSG